MAMRGASLVASCQKDPGKPVNAKRKEISYNKRGPGALVYRTWKEKSYVNNKIPEKKIIIFF